MNKDDQRPVTSIRHDDKRAAYIIIFINRQNGAEEGAIFYSTCRKVNDFFL